MPNDAKWHSLAAAATLTTATATTTHSHNPFVVITNVIYRCLFADVHTIFQFNRSAIQNDEH